jgi:hypothetical protein
MKKFILFFLILLSFRTYSQVSGGGKTTVIDTTTQIETRSHAAETFVDKGDSSGMSGYATQFDLTQVEGGDPTGEISDSVAANRNRDDGLYKLKSDSTANSGYVTQYDLTQVEGGDPTAEISDSMQAERDRADAAYHPINDTTGLNFTDDINAKISTTDIDDTPADDADVPVSSKWVYDNVGTSALSGVYHPLNDTSGFGITDDINAKANTASPTFTGTITIGSAGIDETELEILDGATVTTLELNYVSGVTSSIQTQLDDTVVTSDYCKMRDDSCSFFVGGLGRGLLADTAQMVNGAKGGVFFWDADSLEVVHLRTCMSSGSGTEAATINVFWGDAFGTATDSLFTSATAVSTLGGETDVPNNVSTIPPRQYVWMVIRGFTAGNLPAGIWSTIVGYIKRD